MSWSIKLRNAAASFIDRSPLRWVAITLIAVTVVGTAAQIYLKLDRELSSLALSRREAATELSALTLSERFGRSIDVGLALATRVKFTELVSAKKWGEAIAIMRHVPTHFPYIDRVFLADAGGTLRADFPSLSGMQGISFSDQDWYRGVSQHWTPYVSSVYTPTALPEGAVLTVAIPIKNPEGKIIGILGLQIALDNMLQWLSATPMDPDTSVYLLDGLGEMVFYSGKPEQKKIVIRSAPLLIKKMSQSTQRVAVAFDELMQQKSIINYAHLPGYGWGVVMAQPVSSSKVLQARDYQLRLLLAGYALILALGALTAYLIMRTINASQRMKLDRHMKAELEQRVLDRTNELQVANRELESFSYAVSHDLRAPLRSIDGFSKAVEEDYANQLDEKGRDFINRIRTATQHMGQLIDDMLALSYVTLSEMQRVNVNLSKLAANVFAELQKSEPGRNVNQHIEPGMYAAGDPHLLRLLLLNLLGNAWKFTGKSANATIEFGTMQDANGSTLFFVRDNGAGFDMTYADNLFGAFRRLHTTAEFQGTGIGLATVRRIINRHGGTVSGVGSPGRGATFYFTLSG